MKCTSTFGTAHLSFSIAVRLRPPAPAWSSKRKDVERASQHRTDHHCQNGRGCVALGREKKAAHLQIYMPRVYAYMLTHTHTPIMHISQTHTHDKLVVSTLFGTNSHTHTHTMRKILMNYSCLPPMQFCVGHPAHHHAILHYFLLILSSLISSHFCLTCCPVTTNSPPTI